MRIFVSSDSNFEALPSVHSGRMHHFVVTRYLCYTVSHNCELNEWYVIYLIDNFSEWILNAVISFLMFVPFSSFGVIDCRTRLKIVLPFQYFMKALISVLSCAVFFIPELFCTRWNVICIVILSNNCVFILGDSMSLCYIVFSS